VKVTATELPGVLVVEPRVFSDERGFFCELHRDGRGEHGLAEAFVQDNFSRSHERVLRGLHFQEPSGQGKLIQCLRGAVFDVAVDVRRGSPTFGRWVGVELDERSVRQLWIPAGFAHGFCALEAPADILYKCTARYAPDHERTIAWNDPDLAIRWPIRDPRLSPRDAAAPRLRDAPVLPSY
jgi:dTDP-4-dehydrorhamnose 3,5-epimerase